MTPKIRLAPKNIGLANIECRSKKMDLTSKSHQSNCLAVFLTPEFLPV